MALILKTPRDEAPIILSILSYQGNDFDAELDEERNVYYIKVYCLQNMKKYIKELTENFVIEFKEE